MSFCPLNFVPVKWFVTQPMHEMMTSMNSSFRFHGAWFRRLRNSENIGTVRNATKNQIGPGISASCRAKKTPQGQAKIRTPPERGRALIPNIARVALHAIIVLRPDD